MAISQFITFNIMDHLVGIDIKDVREINRILEITPVQHAPDYVRGLINLRGNTVTVFDLAVRIGFGKRDITEESHNIILKKDAVGLIVDNIGDVIEADENEIEIPPANLKGMKSRFVEGVKKLNENLLVILSASKIIEYDGVYKEKD
ncbi:MAG: chemotaxis protein CheW [Proteobacteria bacterium]|nr:chemotaxis protein CheW [Pseudomonadota bacterium]